MPPERIPVTSARSALDVGSRIVVLGPSGAGKSTLAARLADLLATGCIDLDAMHWLPGWRRPDPDDFRRRVAAAVEGSGWVVAGNYESVGPDLIWPRADTFAWLDLPLRVVLPRILRRAWRRHRSGELLWGTCQETFWKHLVLWDEERSLVTFTARRHAVRRRAFSELRASAHSSVRWHRFTRQGEVDAWLARGRAAVGARPGGP